MWVLDVSLLSGALDVELGELSLELAVATGFGGDESVVDSSVGFAVVWESVGVGEALEVKVFPAIAAELACVLMLFRLSMAPWAPSIDMFSKSS